MEEGIRKIYTPREHILVGEVYSKDGTIFLRLKKSKKEVKEDIKLDVLLEDIFKTLKH